MAWFLMASSMTALQVAQLGFKRENLVTSEFHKNATRDMPESSAARPEERRQFIQFTADKTRNSRAKVLSSVFFASNTVFETLITICRVVIFFLFYGFIHSDINQSRSRHSCEPGIGVQGRRRNPEETWIPGQARNDRLHETYVVIYTFSP